MKQNDSSIKYGCIIVLLIMILLAIGFLFFFFWRAGLIPDNFNPISNISSNTSTSNDPQNSSQDNFGIDPDYREHTFLPFDFKFSVPSDWFVGTTDLPVEPGYGKCFVYHISSPGEFARIEVKPMCFSHGGGDMVCPETIKSIWDYSNYSIGRYRASDVNPNRPGLIYTNYIREENSCGGEFVSNGIIAMQITAFYYGPQSEWPRYLRELDKIVLSIAKQ